MPRARFTLNDYNRLGQMIQSQADRVVEYCVTHKIDPRYLDASWRRQYGWQIEHIVAAYARRCDVR